MNKATKISYMIHTLTTLRFICAFMVLMSHADWLMTEGVSNDMSQAFFEYGHSGVSFFFILSGFILSYAHPKVENTLKFYTARFFRIYPLHILSFAGVFIITLVLFTFLKQQDLPAYFMEAALYQIFLLHAWNPDQTVYFSFNSPSWTLAAEAFFYALFPCLIRLRGAWLYGITLVSFLSPFIWIEIFDAAPDFAFYINPFSRLYEFITGILLYRVFQKGWRPRHLNALEYLWCCGFLAIHLAVPFVPKFISYAYMFTPFYAAGIYIFVWQAGPVSRFLSSKLWVLLGHASFALYMVHYPVLNYGEIFMTELGIEPGQWLIYPFIAAIIAISILVHLYFEKPLYAALKHKFIQA